jgi:GlpG protein
MRRIGRVDSQLKADAFAAVQHQRGIELAIDHIGEQWELWCLDEDRVEEMRKELPRFLDEHPEDGQLRAHLKKAPEVSEPKVRVKAKSEPAAGSGRGYTMKLPKGRSWFNVAPVTVVLMAVSLLVGIATEFGDNRFVGWLVMGPAGSYRDVLTHGELWRLLTPIFVHFGILHLVFNMWWLRDLGVMVERALGRWKLASLVVVIAVVSNLVENLLAAPGSIAGGMSGVVFGLLSYAWVRGRLDLTSGVYIPNQIMVFMGIFFLFCWTGKLGNIANITHTAGLVVGSLWGYLDATHVAKR